MPTRWTGWWCTSAEPPPVSTKNPHKSKTGTDVEISISSTVWKGATMSKIIECVPNFSEGRDKKVFFE